MANRRTKTKANGPTPRELTADRMEGRFPSLITRQMGHAAYLLADGRMFCFITRDGDVALKLSFERVLELLDQGTGSPLRMGKRTMRGWLTMPESDSRELVKLMHEAKAFVESVPPAKRAAKKASSKRLPKKK